MNGHYKIQRKRFRQGFEWLVLLLGSWISRATIGMDIFWLEHGRMRDYDGITHFPIFLCKGKADVS